MSTSPYDDQSDTARRARADAQNAGSSPSAASGFGSAGYAGSSGFPGAGSEARPQSPSYAPKDTVATDAPRPAAASAVQVEDGAAPRVARLTVASIDPWSALKLSFLLSVAAVIALVIGVAVLWLVLDGIGVFNELNKVLGSIGLSTETEKFDIYKYVGFGKVISIAIVIGVVNAALLTALATVTTLLYNLSAGLVGGVRVTLSDD